MLNYIQNISKPVIVTLCNYNLICIAFIWITKRNIIHISVKTAIISWLIKFLNISSNPHYVSCITFIIICVYNNSCMNVRIINIQNIITILILHIIYCACKCYILITFSQSVTYYACSYYCHWKYKKYKIIKTGILIESYTYAQNFKCQNSNQYYYRHCTPMQLFPVTICRYYCGYKLSYSRI